MSRAPALLVLRDIDAAKHAWWSEQPSQRDGNILVLLFPCWAEEAQDTGTVHWRWTSVDLVWTGGVSVVQ